MSRSTIRACQPDARPRSDGYCTHRKDMQFRRAATRGPDPDSPVRRCTNRAVHRDVRAQDTMEASVHATDLKEHSAGPGAALDDKSQSVSVTCVRCAPRLRLPAERPAQPKATRRHDTQPLSRTADPFRKTSRRTPHRVTRGQVTAARPQRRVERSDAPTVRRSPRGSIEAMSGVQ